MSSGIKKRLNSAMLGSLFAALVCANAVVGAATEVEPNDTKAQAQVLVITETGATVSGITGTGSGTTTDLDIYAFDAKAGDVPVLMVNTNGKWDSLLVLFDSEGNLLDQNDDAVSMNPGSVSALDSRVDSHRLTADGTYYVAVSPMPRFLNANFQIALDIATTGGAYTLVVQGVTPPAPPAPTPDPEPVPTPDPEPVPTPDPDPVPPPSGGLDPRIVTVHVMHWRNDEPSLGKFKGKDPIPVAILSAPDFDATEMIDEKSLTFGATGDEKSLIRCKKKGKDVRVDKARDGMKDLVCYFRPDLAGFQAGDVQAFLKGNLVGGGEIEGSASLKTFEVKKKKDKSWHERHNVNPRAKQYRPKDRN